MTTRYPARRSAVSFDGLNSRYAMLIDADSGEAIASRDADARMYPASLTRDMTTLVAHAMQNDTFRAIAGSRSHTMSSASLHDGDLTVNSTVFEEPGPPFVAGGWIVSGKIPGL